MGTVALSSSIAQWTASNPSVRCSELMAIITDASPIGTSPTNAHQTILTFYLPVLWYIAMCITFHFSRTWIQIFFNSLSAIGLYASYSNRRTSFPLNLFLVTPMNVEIAPAPGSPTSSQIDCRWSLSSVTTQISRNSLSKWDTSTKKALCGEQKKRWLKEAIEIENEEDKAQTRKDRDRTYISHQKWVV